MTVSNTTSRNQYTSTSGQTVFPYTFEIFDKNDIAVLKNGTLLSEGTNYTVSGVGNDSGGNITLTVGATAGDILTFYRDMAYQRLTDYQNSGDFLAQEVNDDFDRLWLAVQQNSEGNDRAIVKPITDSASIDMTLPASADRANSFLTFDATGAPSVTRAGDPAAPSSIVRQQFTGDGATLVYTLASAPGALGQSMQVFIDGVYQENDTYSVSGTSLTFSEAPPLNASIETVAFEVNAIGETSSNLVSYTPAGSGAVQTTVQSKLRETVSVKDFGAVGDGVTDDTAAIQAAIDYAATNRLKVIIPSTANHYKLTSSLIIANGTSGISIIGESFYFASTLTQYTDNTPIIEWNGGDFNAIDNLTLNHNVQQTASSPNGVGIFIKTAGGSFNKFTNLTGNKLRRVITTDPSDTTITMSNTLFENIKATNTVSGAVIYKSVATGASVSNRFINIWHQGLSVDETAFQLVNERSFYASSIEFNNITENCISFQTCTGVIDVIRAETITYSTNTPRIINLSSGCEITIGTLELQTLNFTATSGATSFIRKTVNGKSTLHIEKLVIVGVTVAGSGVAAIYNIASGATSDVYTIGTLETDSSIIFSDGAGIGRHVASIKSMLAKKVSADNGDANVTLTDSSESVQLYNTTLTANRRLTLPHGASNIVFDGLNYQVVRNAGTPGAFTLELYDPIKSAVIGTIASGANGELTGMYDAAYNGWRLVSKSVF